MCVWLFSRQGRHGSMTALVASWAIVGSFSEAGKLLFINPSLDSVSDRQVCYSVYINMEALVVVAWGVPVEELQLWAVGMGVILSTCLLQTPTYLPRAF